MTGDRVRGRHKAKGKSVTGTGEQYPQTGGGDESGPLENATMPACMRWLDGARRRDGDEMKVCFKLGRVECRVQVQQQVTGLAEGRLGWALWRFSGSRSLPTGF
jgi:hypothetical protein